MDTLTFITEILKATAWPIAVIFVALLFRKDLKKLLTRVKKGKLASAEFEFEQELRSLEASAPHSPQVVIAPESVELAIDNPRAAILEAWVKLEKAAKHLAFEHQVFQPAQVNSIMHITRALSKSGLVSNDDISLLNELRHTRNYAVHEVNFSPSPDSVLEYVRLAQGLEQRLRDASVVR